MIIRHRAKITEGKQLHLWDRERFERQLQSYKANAKVWVIIKEDADIRSLRQNAYYHGVLVKRLAHFCGYEHDEMHEALKWKFLQKPEAPIPTVRSTTTLTTKEFKAYNESIKRWAAQEFDLYLPDPNEVETYVW